MATATGWRESDIWQELGDSNPRPSVLETDALPTELNSCSFAVIGQVGGKIKVGN